MIKVKDKSGIILCMDSANERMRYYVTPSFIGRAHTQNDPCKSTAELIKDTPYLILILLSVWMFLKNKKITGLPWSGWTPHGHHDTSCLLQYIAPMYREISTIS